MKNNYVLSCCALLLTSFLFIFSAATVNGQCGTLSFGTVTFNASEGFFEVDVFYDRSAPGVIVNLIQTSIKFDDTTVEIDQTATVASTGSDFLTTVSPTLVTFNGFNPSSNGITLGGVDTNLIGTIHFTMLSGETTDIDFNNKTIREDGGNCQASIMNETFTAPLIEIKGQVLNYASTNGLANAKVLGDNKTRSNPINNDEDTTPSNGKYTLTAIGGNDYDVSFTVDGPHDGGGCVTSVDIDTLNKHILGFNPFTNPAAYLAADVDKSDTVSTFDLIQILQVILDVDSVALEDQNWLEVPKTEFNGYSNPINFVPSVNGKIDINSISSSVTGEDFFAIKGGDVNFSCNPVTTTARFIPNEDVRSIKVSPQALLADQPARIPIYGPDFSEANVISIGLAPIPGLTILGIESGLLKVNEFNFKISDEAIDFLWATDNADGTELTSNAPLFFLEVNPTKDIEDVSTLFQLKNNRAHTNIVTHLKSSNYTTLEMEVANNTRGKQLQLESKQTGRRLLGEVLVTPNPFNSEFMLSLKHTKNENGFIRLINGQSGVLISQIPFSFHEGLNNIEIDQLVQMPAGLYTYQIILGGETLSGKIIKSK